MMNSYRAGRVNILSLCQCLLIIFFMGACMQLGATHNLSNGLFQDKNLSDQRWAWNYKMVCSRAQKKQGSYKGYVSFAKKHIPPFSQLIFSWNALRPSQGYYTFYAKTRNATNKQWSKWHKMVDWGCAVQKSYYSEDEHSKYVYVRLETGTEQLADAFEIQVESHDGAAIADVETLSVCVSDFTKFKPERIIKKRIEQIESIHIAQVPQLSQRVVDHPHAACICSPTSCSMLARFFTDKEVDVAEFADCVFDAGFGVYGSWPFNVAQLYDACCQPEKSNKNKVSFCLSRMNSFYDIYERLKQHIPVIVSVRGKLDGALKAYNGGHFIVVVGWDANKKAFICHDPAFYSDHATLVSYGVTTFVRAWEKSRRLAYVAEYI